MQALGNTPEHSLGNGFTAAAVSQGSVQCVTHCTMQLCCWTSRPWNEAFYIEQTLFRGCFCGKIFVSKPRRHAGQPLLQKRMFWCQISRAHFPDPVLSVGRMLSPSIITVCFISIVRFCTSFTAAGFIVCPLCPSHKFCLITTAQIKNQGVLSCPIMCSVSPCTRSCQDDSNFQLCNLTCSHNCIL